jgi:SnoaL-like domain
MTAHNTTVNDYLSAFYSGNFDRARAHVAEDFQFKGPFVEANGRDGFFASAARLAPIARGFELLHQWSDGHDVCSIFDLRLQTPLGSGSVTVCEWHQLRGALLARGRVILDTAVFRALVPPAP